MSIFPLPGRFNVGDLLLADSLRGDQGRRPYLLTEAAALSRTDAVEKSSRAGHALRRLGVEPEQRVALLLGDSLDFPVCFWAVLRIGAVALPLNPLLRPADWRAALEDSRARVLLLDSSLWPAVAADTRGLRHLRAIVAVGPSQPGLPNLGQLTKREASRLEGERISADDPALWLYTSGSTGRPKAAIHLAGDLVHGVHMFPRCIGLTGSDLLFSAPRMHFAYGLGNSLLFPLATAGSAVIQAERPTPGNVLRTLDRFRPSVFFAGPALLQGMLDTVHGGEASFQREPRLSYLRFTVSAGEALPAPLYRKWRRVMGHEVLDCVGSTENLTFFLANRPGESRPGDSGHPVSGFELRLVDERGRDVPEGEAGTLWVSGPTAAARYWNRQDLTSQVMRGRWLVTGDRFRRLPGGRFEFLGRDDDMIKVGGSWVSPAEVEQVLLSHPGVSECAVVGRRDERGLGQAAAIVVARPGYPVSQLSEALFGHLRSNLVEFKVPRWMEFAPSLPRTATGKLQRFRLRAG